MIRFSPSDAALEGFRVTRERPLSVLVWAGARLVFSVLALVLLLVTGGAAFVQMIAIEHGHGSPSPQVVQALMGRLAPSLLGFFLLNLAFYAVVYTATLRAILRPGETSFAYLRLSMDELRQFGLAAICLSIFFLYAFVLTIIASIIVGVASTLGQAGALVTILLVMAVAAALIYPAVRLSLAPAMTFTEGKIILFRSISLTRHQFWPMFGAYVLAFILTVVVVLLAAVIFMFIVGAIGMAQSGGLSGLTAMMGVMSSNSVSLATLMTPTGIANLAFSALLNTLAYIILVAPAAAIFRDLAGRPSLAASGKPSQPWG